MACVSDGMHIYIEVGMHIGCHACRTSRVEDIMRIGHHAHNSHASENYAQESIFHEDGLFMLILNNLINNNM